MEMEDMAMLIVYVILGVGLLIGIANTITNTNQNPITVTNKTLTFANNTIIKLESYNLVPNSELVYGANGSITMLVLNAGANYSINYNPGRITFLQTTPTVWYNNSLVNITYQYYPASYVNDGSVRTIYSGIMPFLAILVLVGVWFYFRDV